MPTTVSPCAWTDRRASSRRVPATAWRWPNCCPRCCTSPNGACAPASSHASFLKTLPYPPPRVREDTPAADTFALDAACGLISHYKPPKEFDSILEEAFAARWEKLDTPWTLEREVDLVPVPGSAIIPDFRVAHPDGRSVLVEIVGFWRPEYLRKKFALLRRSGRRDIVLAVSERLNLDAAGVNLDEFADRLVWFKGKLEPKAVLECVEAVAASLLPPTPPPPVKKRKSGARPPTRKPPAGPAP